MTMRTTMLIGASLMLALAGCGGSDKAAEGEAGGGGTETAAAPGGGAAQIQPGEWEVTMETLNIEAPNMPPEAAAMMKKSMGEKNTSRQCITAEEVSGDFITANQEANCTREGFSFAGGRIQGTMTCTGEDGKATITMNGSHSGTSYDMRSKMTSENQAGSMTIETRNTGRRLGDCPPGSE
jgi:Protein of unknown function (DUF3617)